MLEHMTLKPHVQSMPDRAGISFPKSTKEPQASALGSFIICTICTPKTQPGRLTRSLTPHSPAGAFAPKDSASPLLTLSEKNKNPAGLTSKARHARRTFAGLRGSFRPRLASTFNRRRARTALPIIETGARPVKRIYIDSPSPRRKLPPLLRNFPGVQPRIWRNTFPK